MIYPLTLLMTNLTLFSPGNIRCYTSQALSVGEIRLLTLLLQFARKQRIVVKT